VHGVRDTGGCHSAIVSPDESGDPCANKAGDTAAFVGSSVLKKHFGFDHGFAVYDDEMPKPDPRKVAAEYAERRAGAVVDRAIRWLASQQRNPFFSLGTRVRSALLLTIHLLPFGKITWPDHTTER